MLGFIIFHLGKEEVKVKMSGLYEIPLFILPDAVSTLLHTALCHGTLGSMNYINAFWSTRFSQQRTTGRKESKISDAHLPIKWLYPSTQFSAPVKQTPPHSSLISSQPP